MIVLLQIVMFALGAFSGFAFALFFALPMFLFVDDLEKEPAADAARGDGNHGEGRLWC